MEKKKINIADYAIPRDKAHLFEPSSECTFPVSELEWPFDRSLLDTTESESEGQQ